MCVARVGRVVSTGGKKAQIRFFDRRTSSDVDLSVTPARKGAYVEVFGNVAPSVLNRAEARRREAAWQQIKKVAVAARAQLEAMARGR